MLGGPGHGFGAGCTDAGKEEVPALLLDFLGDLFKDNLKGLINGPWHCSVPFYQFLIIH